MYIRKRGNKYYYTILIHTEDGLRKLEKAGTESLTETKKLQMAAQVQADRDHIIPRSVTVAEFLAQWEKESLKDAKANTRRNYHNAVERHIVPIIGKRKLEDLTPRMLALLLDHLKDAGYAKNSVNIVRSVLKRSLIYACDYCRLLSYNPAQNLKLPNYQEPPKETSTFSPEDMEKIKKHFRENKLFAPIMLSYYTGMRAGEICGLRWSDVSFSQNEVFVRRTVVLEDGYYEIQNLPKTKSAVRSIVYGNKCRELLVRIKDRQNECASVLENLYNFSGYVITNDDGSMMTPDQIRNFNKWVKANLGHGSFHSLRHTYATNLLEAGASLELVSKQLGHASIVVTSSTYSHVLDRRKKELTGIINLAL